MNTVDYIFELLYEHDCVIVPGFGGFVTNYHPAKIHPVLHTFAPPTKDILFNPRLVTNDGILISHISRTEGISYERATQRIQQEVVQIQQMLDQSQKFEIVNVGCLSKDIEGSLQFEPAATVNFLLTSYGLGTFVSPAIQRDNAVIHHEQLMSRNRDYKKDRKIPSALKRSVTIGIPAVVVLAFAIFSAGNMGSWLPQTSDLFPRFNTKTMEVPAAPKTSDKQTYFAQSFQSNLFDLRTQGLRAVDTAAIRNVAVGQEQGNFCIVGNCFSVEENAIRYTNELKAKGYQGASYFKPETANLFRVYFSRFATREDAEIALKEVKQQCAPQAWILEM